MWLFRRNQTPEWHSGDTKRPILDMCSQSGSSRELSGVMLSMNMYCEFVKSSWMLSSNHCSQIRTINENQDRKNSESQALQSILVSSKNPLWILLIIILKQSTELRSTPTSLSTNSPCLPCYDSNQRNIMFFMENFIKTSFSWQLLMTFRTGCCIFLHIQPEVIFLHIFACFLKHFLHFFEYSLHINAYFTQKMILIHILCTIWCKVSFQSVEAH